VKQTRLLIHEDTCPDRIKSNLRICPYNPIHKISAEKYESHKKVCDQRPKIDEDLQKEMREFIKNKNLEENKSENVFSSYSNQNQNLPTRYGPKKDISLHDVNKSTSTVGLRGEIAEKNKNKERRIKQKEMMNLIENSEILEDDMNSGPDEIDDIYEKDFNINNFDHLNNFNNFDKQSNITLTNLTDFVNGDIFNLTDNVSDKNEYDPNESDMFIGKKNKNNVKGNEKFENEFSMVNTMNDDN
jgi:hypothetical protein